MTTYAEKLRDPRWQKKRLEILNRDEWTCQLCEDRGTELHIHHLEYNGEPWEVQNEKLITYCKHCHPIVELLSKLEMNLIVKMNVKREGEFTVTMLCLFQNENGSHGIFSCRYNKEANQIETNDFFHIDLLQLALKKYSKFKNKKRCSPNS